MKTIDMNQLETVTGGTFAANKRFVTSFSNPKATMSVDVTKGQQFAYVKNLVTGAVTRLHRAAMGTHAH